tara:strand:- start:201 stop:593 length:393 start_codon:yes stop_codon:yes gene_type:complete
MPARPTFKDLNVSFKPHPVTEDLMVVKDNADIKQSVKNLLLTRKGERLFNSDLGTGLFDLLFEPLDVGTATLIREQVGYVLRKYEPRVRLNEIIVDTNFEDNGYDISVAYNVLGRDDIQSNVDFFLEAAR